MIRQEDISDLQFEDVEDYSADYSTDYSDDYASPVPSDNIHGGVMLPEKSRGSVMRRLICGN